MEQASILIILAIFVVAVLYSSVGHGGASGYLAVMAFLAVASGITRPTALVLNVFVAAVGTIMFYRAGHFSWRFFLPFAVASVPAAFIGGMIVLPTTTYRVILGIVLLLAAGRLAWKFAGESTIKPPPIWLCLVIGAMIGLLSGLVGVGGGIFLTPVLLLMHWAEPKQAAGVSAMFILVNSLAGIAGSHTEAAALPAYVGAWVAAAVIGGLIGSTLGARRFDSLMLRRVLAVVLLVAGGKLIFA